MQMFKRRERILPATAVSAEVTDETTSTVRAGEAAS
jgi:hypothetical protein